MCAISQGWSRWRRLHRAGWLTCSSSRSYPPSNSLSFLGTIQSNILPANFKCHGSVCRQVLLLSYFEHDNSTSYIPQGLTRRELLEYMRALFRILSQLHELGYVHRDIKPANYLYKRDKGRFLLTDFGLAHVCRTERAGPPPSEHSAPCDSAPSSAALRIPPVIVGPSSATAPRPCDPVSVPCRGASAAVQPLREAQTKARNHPRRPNR